MTEFAKFSYLLGATAGVVGLCCITIGLWLIHSQVRFSAFYLFGQFIGLIGIPAVVFAVVVLAFARYQ